MIELKFSTENAVELAEAVTSMAQLLTGNAKAEAKPEAKAEVKPEAKAEAKAEAKPEAKAEAKAEEPKRRRRRTKAEIEAEAKAKAEAEAEAEAEAKAKAKAKAEAEAEAEAEALNYELHIRPVMAELVNQPDGGREAAVAILRSFGVANGKDLKPEQLGDVLKAAKAKIQELQEDFI